jgi:hypothetical protein
MSAADRAELLMGRLHLYVAFDWAEEIDLEQAGRLAPAAVLTLARRPRTPSSITYKPPPLRFQLEALSLDLPVLGATPVSTIEATVFDFAAVSVAMHVPFQSTSADLTALAGQLADPSAAQTLVQTARRALEPLYQRLQPAIQKPFWHEDLWEEYIVFQFPPAVPADPSVLLKERTGWLASLLRLEDQPLSESEIAEAVRLLLRYSCADLFVPDWAAAVLIDDEQACIETPLRSVRGSDSVGLGRWRASKETAAERLTESPQKKARLLGAHQEVISEPAQTLTDARQFR